MSRQLIVMRHAKAGAHTATDHERSLTERGVRDSTEAGSWLAAKSYLPDHAIVSSAARAVETWQSVAAASGATADAAYSDALYSASPSTVLEELTKLPADARRVIYVGHNPEAEAVAGLLDDGEGDAEATGLLQQDYPTSALTVFEVEVPWAEIDEGSGRVIDFHVGRG